MVWILLLTLTQALNVYELQIPKVFAHFTHEKMTDSGYAVLSDAVLEEPTMLSKILAETAKFYPTDHNFSYALGNVQGRTLVDPDAPGIFNIGGAPKQVLVSGHSEASYLNLSPRFLTFTCFQEAEIGGQTPLYNIKALEDIYTSTPVGRKMFEDVFDLGVTYVRNDPSADGPLADAWKRINYPTWQSRFPGKNRTQILEDLWAKDMVAYFDDDDTLHSEWHFRGFRPHPDTGENVWFNQLYAMNGRYWRQHGDAEILSLPLDKRPLDTKIGALHNNREVTEAEYDILDGAHLEVVEMFDWKKGMAMYVDNFAYQHGRMPYDGPRRCAVGWGPPVHVSNTQPVTKPVGFGDGGRIHNCFSQSM